MTHAPLSEAENEEVGRLGTPIPSPSLPQNPSGKISVTIRNTVEILKEQKMTYIKAEA